MPLTSIPRRRWIGTLALTTALGMLVIGQTLLKGRLNDLAFLIYWLVCFAFTGLAMAMALLDMRAVQSRTRQEHRNLLDTTLKEIQDEARNKQKRQKNPKTDGRWPTRPR